MDSGLRGATVCYLFKDEKILLLKFSKKWGQIYAPPGGKMEEGETPTECIIREYKEETGLRLLNPRLKGISYWQKKEAGIIFVFIATEFSGDLERATQEGTSSWISIAESRRMEQFPMNKIFFDSLFEEGIFEGKFVYDEDDATVPEKVISYSMSKI